LATFGKYVVIWCQKYSVLFGYAQLTWILSILRGKCFSRK
jgi:hypothetical protein